MVPRIMSAIFAINFFFIYSITFSQDGTLNPTLTLKNINGVYVPYQNGIPVPSFEKQNRQIISLKGTWKKQRFTANQDISLARRDTTGYLNLISEAQDRHLSNFNDDSWEDKNIPSVENTIYNFPKVPEYYQDGVWYRHKFDVPDSLNGKFIKLIFYSVNYIADVWLNGEYIGYHEGGYTPFAFDVSGKLVYGGQNVIAVRVDNPEWGKRNDIVPYPAVDWFNYAGIIHDVYLEVADPVSVTRTDIVPKSTNGDIQATVIILNKSGQNKSLKAKITIYNAEINQANLKSEYISDLAGQPAIIATPSQGNTDILIDSVGVWRTNLKVENPQLWSPKNPNLYVMKVSLIDNGNLIDEYYTQFGIRTVVTAADKVLLNNKVVFFTGIARHEDHPLYGRSIPIDTIFSDLEKVKGINANFLRTAHYPNHPYTYLIADRLGIAIMEEIPVWQFDLEEAWQIQNNERHIHEQMFKEMIYKDFNRPSILLWSTCNECKDVDNRKIFIQNMGNELNNKIQDGRLLTQSAAADRPGPEDPSQSVCDVAGWTLYFGIFYGTSYSGGTNNFLINAKAKNPDKPVLDTEFGYWSSEDNSTIDRQLKVFNDTFNSFKLFAPISSSGQYNSNGFLMGVTWWCIFDWYSHGHPNGYQSMGLYSMDRSILKPVGQTLRDAYLPYFNLGGTLTEVGDESKKDNPKEFSLSQNYPNPFNPVTKIRYSIPFGGTSLMKYVQLKVYDILGNEVATLINEEKPAGNYEIEFNGSNLTSGIYFYRLGAGKYYFTRKMMVLK